MNTQSKEIVLYGTRWCYDSIRTRRWLDNHAIAYQYIDIDDSPEARSVVEQINRGYRSVPTLVFPDGTTLTEPSTMALAEKIKLYFGEQPQTE